MRSELARDIERDSADPAQCPPAGGVHVCSSVERAGDGAALEMVPFGGELRALLIEPLLFQHWDDATERAFWLASDGAEVRCVTITGLGALQMADLWTRFNDRISRAQFNISPQLVREVIEARMRVSVELVN